MFNAGSYPALIECENGVRIDGEVWEIDNDCVRTLDIVEGVPHLYQRMHVILTDPHWEPVETYVYQRPVGGMPDCGSCWEHPKR
jgi:gamma-glutamylcyclotransferase (GGCT)/AIG2-like uncharacterized protein YtfP